MKNYIEKILKAIEGYKRKQALLKRLNRHLNYHVCMHHWRVASKYCDRINRVKRM
jgi:hypothetical protein